MTIFEIGDFVKDCSGQFVGVVCREGQEHEGRVTWEVYWHDGDTTYYEDSESMSSHKIEPCQWNIMLINKYMDIICP
tara:strand:- start:403 stop:633 length:231 start_codon:yes stop_codon:yes gene_type:complete